MKKSRMDVGLFVSRWVRDCEDPKNSKAGNTPKLGFPETYPYLCLDKKFEIEDPKNDRFCRMHSDGSSRCLLEQLIGQYGHKGPFDLTV